MSNQHEQKYSVSWAGYCPESLLNGRKVRMRLNEMDFFESEETGLQIAVCGLQAVILKFRGRSKFRTTQCYGDEQAKDEQLSPQIRTEIPFCDSDKIFYEGEIEPYINTQVEKRSIFVSKLDTHTVFLSDPSISKLLLDLYFKEIEIEDILKEKGFGHFSSKKLVGDLGEYYAKLNLQHLFENLEISKVPNADYDLKGKLKPEIAAQWKLQNPEVRIEVKTRYHQIGDPQVKGLHPEKSDLLVFVFLDSVYSCNFIGIVRSNEVKPDFQNRISFSHYKDKLIWPLDVKYKEFKHQADFEL